jgi:hypothetical protein
VLSQLSYSPKRYKIYCCNEVINLTSRTDVVKKKDGVLSAGFRIDAAG